MAYETEHGLSTGESNNSVGTANLLTEEVKTIGALSSGSDVDYYKIVVTEGPALISLAFDTAISSSSKLWNVALLDSQGQDYLVSPTRSAAGTPQIDGDNQSGTTLNVKGLSALPAAGDRFTIATSSADTTIYTVVSSTTLASGTSTLTLDKALPTTAPADDAYLVFDPVQSSVGASATLTAQVSAAGTYYLKVAKADVASTQEYGVTATVTPTTEVEDNDTKQDAADSNNRLLSGVTMTGNLSGDDDVDYWLFTTAAASDFSLDFAASSGNDSSADWNITVTDWNGQAILDAAGTAISMSEGTSASASITDERNPTAKTYVVMVEAAKTGVSTSNYTLKVSGTGLNLNDTPSMTIGSVTSAASNAQISTGVVKSVSAAASGDGTALSLSSLFSASDADSGQTLSYVFLLTKPTGSNSTGFIQVGSTQYGFGTGMTAPTNITLSASQMASAQFYPGTGTGDLTLTLQAKDNSGANDGSDAGAFMQMTLRTVAAGTGVTVAADTSKNLQESNASSTDTLSISLGAAPTTGETVTVYLEHDGEAGGAFQLDFSTSTLTFNSSNWNQAQTVTVTAREDNKKETSQTGKVSFRVVSSDSNSAYNDLAVDTLGYTLTDAANHAPTGSVTLAGTATQGQVLTASNTLADSDGLGTITHEWQESADGSTWSTIAGSGTGTTYTLANAQAGKQVRVLAKYTDQESNAESVASDATTAVANINDAPTVANAIADQTAVAGRLFGFTFGSNAFSDVDPSGDGGTLTYSASQVDSNGAAVGDGSLPGWLGFTAASRTFASSNVTANANDVVYIKVTATDNANPALSVSDIFAITVNAASTGTPAQAQAIADQGATEDSAFSYTVANGTFTDTDNTTGQTDTTASLTYTATEADGDALPTWLTFTAGSLTFSGTPANTDVGTLSVKLTASDGSLSTSDIFDIVVANTNDLPTGSVTLSGTATQGNTLTAGNTLVDADGIGTLGYQWQSSANGTTWSNITGANSTTYKLTQSEVGKQVRVVVSYTDQRASAESVPSSATSAVANINDAPDAVNDTATAVEAGGTANGTLGTDPTGNVLGNDTDPDTGDTVTVSAISGGSLGVARAGSYGSLTLSADGSYTYAVNNDNASVKALRGSANTLTDTFTYTARDAAGLTDTANLVVTIQGANDAPTVASAIAGQAKDTLYAGSAWTFAFAAGTFADVDSGDSLGYAATLADGSALPSWLGFDAATRTFSTTGAPAAGTSVDVKLTATDLGGLTVTDNFTLTVQDPGPSAPTLTAPTAIALTDTAGDDSFTNQEASLAGALGTSGTGPLAYGIVGGTDNGTTVSKAGGYGTLTVTKATGAYSFAPSDTAIEGLSANASDSFTVTVTDTGNDLSASRLLAINVTGANDTPALTAPTAISYTDSAGTDDFTAHQSATLAASDRDASASLAYGISGGTDAGGTVTKAGSFGTLTVTKATGAYTYTPDDTAINQLGYDAAESFTVTVSDGSATTTQTLSINLTGADDTSANDRPKLTTASTLTNGQEGQAYTIQFSALQTAADEADREGDATVTSFRVMAVSSGTLTKGGTAVTAGETTIASGQTLIWTPATGQNGTLDAFTIVAVDSGGLASLTPVQVKVAVAQDNSLTSSGALQNTQANEAGVGADGNTQAGVDATGAASALMANITDAGTATMTVTKAQEGTAGSFANVTQGTTSASGGLAVIGLYGTLTVGADGSYGYVVDQANTSVQAMIESGSLTDQFIVQITAGQATGNQTINIVIDGTNDALPTSSNDSVTTNEDTTVVLSLSDFGNYSDGSAVEVRALATVKVTTLPGAGALQYNSGTTEAANWTAVSQDQVISAADITAGKLRFVPAANGNGSPYASIGFKVGDGDAHSASAYTLTVNVTAVADPTVFGGATTGAVTEDAQTTTATGTLTASDVDGTAEAAITAQTNTAGTHGSFSIGTDGAWTYTLNNADADTNALAAAATATDSFTAASAGGTTQSITITVTGANDAPTVNTGINDQTATAGSGKVITFDATAFADTDTGAVLSYAATLENGDPLPAWLSFTAATRSFNLDGTQTAGTTVNVKVTATDQGSLSTSDTFTITVNAPASDAPTLAVPTAVALADTAGADTAESIAAATTTDTGTLAGGVGQGSSSQTGALAYGITGGVDGTTTVTKTGTYGSLEVNKTSGAYTFTPNASAINALSGNASESFEVTVTDTGLQSPKTTSQVLTVNVTGVNDAPALANSIADKAVTANEAFDFTVPLETFADLDTGDSLSYTATLADGTALPAWLVFNATTRAFSGTPANGDAGSLGVKVTASDGEASASDTFDLAVAQAGYPLSGKVSFWRDVNTGDANPATALQGVAVTANGVTGNSDTAGNFTLEAIEDADGMVTASASLAGPATKAVSGLTLTDVLAALKLYLGKSLPTTYASPYNYIAADFDGNGSVTLTDVLNMLKYYLGKSTTGNVKPEWVFVDAADSGTAANGSALAKTNTAPHAIDQDLAQDTSIELVGVLRGDVDGSWTA